MRICIWDLNRQLRERVDALPWVIQPCRVIEHAHDSAILSITYLPSAQLIVSSSLDGKIKCWDPVARPHLLTQGSNETSEQNRPFSCVKTIDGKEAASLSVVTQRFFS